MSDSNVYYIFLGLVSFWLLGLSFIVFRLFFHYQSLTRGLSQKDLISALNSFIAKTQVNHEALEQVKASLEKETKDNRLHLQRIGFKRFNPFTDTGGDQSFILSLLDENGTGIVVSSLHSRENTRVYAKRLEKGNCPDQILSKEEKQVIKDSLK